jgi:DNA-binding PadR family transcriptional regulator
MNNRFQNYVTSGAFRLSLTRQQIAALSLLPCDDSTSLAANDLERKGLCEAIAGEHDGRQQFRITAAGAVALHLCHMAGLTNAGATGLADEIEALRAELDAARSTNVEIRELLGISNVKLQRSERELAAAVERLRELTQEKYPIVCLKPEFITPRDHHPYLSRAEVVRLGEEALAKPALKTEAWE